MQGAGGKDQYLERLKNIGVFDSVVEVRGPCGGRCRVLRAAAVLEALQLLARGRHEGAVHCASRVATSPGTARLQSDAVQGRLGPRVGAPWQHQGWQVRGASDRVRRAAGTGGGCSLVPSANVAKVWEASVLQAIGEGFSMSDSVCGLVLARRGGTRGDSLCIWCGLRGLDRRLGSPPPSRNNDCDRVVRERCVCVCVCCELSASQADIERMRGELVATLGLTDVVSPERVVYQPHKGHIDFNQQHPPSPPEARKSGRKSARNSDRKVRCGRLAAGAVR